jgi:hypothetical protein
MFQSYSEPYGNDRYQESLRRLDAPDVDRHLARQSQFAPSLGSDLRSLLEAVATALMQLARRKARENRGIKSFEHELQAAGGLASRVDAGAQIVPVEKVVGSVSRWQNLRSDFFYRTGTAMTGRFERIGQAMRAGKPLPPIEVYKLKKPSETGHASPPTEYYVVDGHHRVAMARKLGQDFLDAHVIAYKVGRPKEKPE